MNCVFCTLYVKINKNYGDLYMDIKIIAEYMREKLESYDENEKFSIKEIAEKFGYTKYEFSRKFKKETGFSAKEFVSVLKLEKSLQKLIKEDKSVILAQLESGYESSGSFSNIFRKNTGLSPREYRKNIVKLQNYKSEMTFVGLFKTPIPSHAPVIGKAVISKKVNNRCTFKNIPDGKYYILACSVEKNGKIFRYFDLKNCLRGKVEKQLIFPSEKEEKFEILFREAIPEDPPILINLPNLLFKVIGK